MPYLFIGNIDAGAPNNGGLRTAYYKYKFRGRNFDEQLRAAKLLAACMKDSEVIPIERTVEATLELDGEPPENVVQQLFNDTDEMVSEDEIIYEAAEAGATLLRDLVACGEELFEFLMAVALVATWPKAKEAV